MECQTANNSIEIDNNNKRSLTIIGISAWIQQRNAIFFVFSICSDIIELKDFEISKEKVSFKSVAKCSLLWPDDYEIPKQIVAWLHTKDAMQWSENASIHVAFIMNIIIMRNSFCTNELWYVLHGGCPASQCL